MYRANLILGSSAQNQSRFSFRFCSPSAEQQLGIYSVILCPSKLGMPYVFSRSMPLLLLV